MVEASQDLSLAEEGGTVTRGSRHQAIGARPPASRAERRAWRVCAECTRRRIPCQHRPETPDDPRWRHKP